MIPFMRNVPQRHIYGNRKRCRCQGLGGGRDGESRVSFWGDDNVLDLVAAVAPFCKYIKNR